MVTKAAAAANREQDIFSVYIECLIVCKDHKYMEAEHALTKWILTRVLNVGACKHCLHVTDLQRSRRKLTMYIAIPTGR